jgi:hypothetical protein
MRLGDAALADKRHPHDARFGPGGFPPYRRTFHVPPGRFVPARRTKQRHAALREVEQRVVSVEAADKLPQLLPNSCHYSGGLRESVWLHRIDRHNHVPLGGSPPLIRTPCAVSAVRPRLRRGTFQEKCQSSTAGRNLRAFNGLRAPERDGAFRGQPEIPRPVRRILRPDELMSEVRTQ